MHACDYNPVVEFVDAPMTLEDKLKEKAINYNKFASYLEYDSKNKEFIKHVYAFKQTSKKWYCQEVYRESESGKACGKNYWYCNYGQACGMHAVWKDSCNYYGANFYQEKFIEYDKPDCNSNRFYCYELNTIEEIIANDLSLKYCKWDRNVNLFEYIKIYRKYPIVEMLITLKLYRLVLNEKCLDYMTKNKSFCKWLYQYKDKISNISFQVLKQSFLNGKDPKKYDNELSLKKSFAREISNRIGTEAYKLIKKHICFERLINYIDNVGGRNYGDYIIAANYFELNFKDTKVLYPDNFKHWHDYYTNRIKTIKNALIDKKIAKQATKYKKLEQYVNGLALILPTKTQDFIDEGKALNHCVGKMGYNEKMAKGESLILFVRDEKEIEKPLYTLEFSPKTKSIRQFYGNHDTVPDEQARHIIYDEWLPLAKQLLSKKENELCLAST